MQIWIVTAQAKEETNTGIIQRVDVRCWGAYSTEERAQQMASKYNGAVTALTVDQEQGANLQHWLNPGYTQE
jgi:hypothetical protein